MTQSYFNILKKYFNFLVFFWKFTLNSLLIFYLMNIYILCYYIYNSTYSLTPYYYKIIKLLLNYILLYTDIYKLYRYIIISKIYKYILYVQCSKQLLYYYTNIFVTFFSITLCFNKLYFKFDWLYKVKYVKHFTYLTLILIVIIIPALLHITLNNIFLLPIFVFHSFWYVWTSFLLFIFNFNYAELYFFSPQFFPNPIENGSADLLLEFDAWSHFFFDSLWWLDCSPLFLNIATQFGFWTYSIILADISSTFAADFYLEAIINTSNPTILHFYDFIFFTTNGTFSALTVPAQLYYHQIPVYSDYLLYFIFSTFELLIFILPPFNYLLAPFFVTFYAIYLFIDSYITYNCFEFLTIFTDYLVLILTQPLFQSFSVYFFLVNFFDFLVSFSLLYLNSIYAIYFASYKFLDIFLVLLFSFVQLSVLSDFIEPLLLASFSSFSALIGLFFKLTTSFFTTLLGFLIVPLYFFINFLQAIPLFLYFSTPDYLSSLILVIPPLSEHFLFLLEFVSCVFDPTPLIFELLSSVSALPLFGPLLNLPLMDPFFFTTYTLFSLLALLTLFISSWRTKLNPLSLNTLLASDAYSSWVYSDFSVSWRSFCALPSRQLLFLKRNFFLQEFHMRHLLPNKFSLPLSSQDYITFSFKSQSVFEVSWSVLFTFSNRFCLHQQLTPSSSYTAFSTIRQLLTPLYPSSLFYSKLNRFISIFYLNQTNTLTSALQTDLLRSSDVFLFKYLRTYANLPTSVLSTRQVNFESIIPISHFVFLPSLLFTTFFESNFWFNEKFALALQSNESASLALRLNSWFFLTDTVNPSGGAWRSTFNSRFLHDFDVINSPYRFSDPNLAPSLAVSRYFDDDRDSDEYFDVWIYEQPNAWLTLPEDTEFFSYRARSAFSSTAFWFATYLDSYEYFYLFLKGSYEPMYIHDKLWMMIDWVDWLSPVEGSSLLITIPFAIARIFLTPLTWGIDWIPFYMFFFVDYEDYQAQRTFFYESALLKLVWDGDNIISKRDWRYFWRSYAGQSLDWFTWIASILNRWQIYYIRHFEWNTYQNLDIRPNLNFLRLPNIYSVFDVVFELPAPKLPLSDNYSLSLLDRPQRLDYSIARHSWQMLPDTYKASRGATTSRDDAKDFFFFRNYANYNRSYWGIHGRDKTLFYENSAFRTFYLQDVLRSPIAVRRFSPFFNNLFDLSSIEASKFKQQAGHWDFNFVMDSMFFERFFYRYWSSQQAFSLKILAYEKFQFFKNFKNYYHEFEHSKNVVDVEDQQLLVQRRAYLMDRLNNKLSYFFKTLHSNFVVFEDAQISVNKIPSSLTTYEFLVSGAVPSYYAYLFADSYKDSYLFIAFVNLMDFLKRTFIYSITVTYRIIYNDALPRLQVLPFSYATDKENIRIYATFYILPPDPFQNQHLFVTLYTLDDSCIDFRRLYDNTYPALLQPPITH